MFEKVEINGPNTHPVYRWLRNNSDLFDKEKKVSKMIPLNFSKFLLNGRGEVVKFFEPLDSLDDVRKEVKLLLWDPFFKKIGDASWKMSSKVYPNPSGTKHRHLDLLHFIINILLNINFSDEVD